MRFPELIKKRYYCNRIQTNLFLVTSILFLIAIISVILYLNSYNEQTNKAQFKETAESNLSISYNALKPVIEGAEKVSFSILGNNTVQNVLNSTEPTSDMAVLVEDALYGSCMASPFHFSAYLYDFSGNFYSSEYTRNKHLNVSEVMELDCYKKVQNQNGGSLLLNADEIFSDVRGLVYHQKTLKPLKKGLEIPKTYDELLEVVSAFNEQGTVPFAIGAKNPSDIAWWTDQLTQRTAGADYVNQILAGEATYDTEETLQAAQMFSELVEAGAFDAGAASTSRDEAYTLFTSGLYPMYFCGSWYCANVMDSDIKDDVVVVNFPTVDGAAGLGTEYLGGADQAFMINSQVENPEKIVEVYTYLCETLSENVFLGGAGLPAWKTDVDVNSIENTLLVDVYNMYKDCTGVNLWWDNALLAEQATEHMDTATKLFMGNITPEEFVSMNTEILQ